MSLFLSSINKSGKYIFWTLEEIEKLKNLINKGMSYEKIASYFTDRTRQSIADKAKKLGYGQKEHKHRDYFHNESFWSEIDPINSYFAGFFAADGNLDKKHKTFKLTLSSKDINLLRKLKEVSSFTGEVIPFIRRDKKTESEKKMCRLIVACRQKWYDDLEKNFKLTPIKTYRLSYPNINDDYLKWCFIVGYIDGDGTLITHSEDVKTVVGIASCSFQILDWIAKEVDKIFPIYDIRGRFAIPSKKNNRNYFRYTVSGLRAAAIINYIRQFPLPKLARKWDKPKIVDRVEIYKNDHPKIIKELTIPEKWQSFPKYENTQIYDIENDPENLFKDTNVTK